MTNPTVEFDHHTPPFVRDPYSIYADLRANCPVAYTESHDGFWILSRYEDVRRALLDWQTFTSSVPGTIALPHSKAGRTQPVIPLEIDPPLHTEYRSILAKHFARPAVDRLEPQVKAIANDLIDQFISRGECDLVQEYSLPLVSGALAIFLGLPLGDTVLWLEWAQAIFADRVTHPEAAQLAHRALERYVDDKISERKAQPRDDVLSALTQARIQGRALTDVELRGYGLELLLAGREATIDGLDNSLWYLAQHPDDRRRLIQDPTLVRPAVDEFLRMMSPIQLLGRIAARDVEIHGQHIHKGDSVSMTYASANRDEEVFSNAAECILDRRPNPHLAFGSGPHTCIGAHLARLDIRVGIGEILRRIPDFGLSLTKPARLAPNGDARGFRSLPVVFERRNEGSSSA